MKLINKNRFSLLFNCAACAGALFAAPGSAGAATTQEAPDTVRMLAVGNSFSVNSSTYVGDIASAAGKKFVFCNAWIGGCPLEKHMELARVHESDPDDPAGKPYVYEENGKETMVSLEWMLRHEKWDYVSIQQFSMYSFHAETFQPYASDLVAYIHKYAPQAKILVHETWSYRSDDPIFTDGFTSAEMYRRLHANYLDVAKEVGASRLLPVGTAFMNAMEDPDWTPPAKVSDAKDFVYPELPDQRHSLNVGWYWTQDEPHSLNFDGHHASPLGCYLGGAVWYEVLFGDVRGNSFVPEGMDPKDVACLQTVAHESVSGGRLPVCLGGK